MHPGAASIDCDSCAKEVYNLKTGQKEMIEIGEGEMVALERHGPPPCYACPKGSPENGKLLELSRENIRLLEFYQSLEAMPNLELPRHLRRCPNTARMLGIVKRTEESAIMEAKAIAMQEARQEDG